MITSEPVKIKYEAIITIPYAHILRDDKIQIETSDIIDTKPSAAYLLLDGTITDQDYETGMDETFRIIYIIFLFNYF